MPYMNRLALVSSFVILVACDHSHASGDVEPPFVADASAEGGVDASDSGPSGSSGSSDSAAGAMITMSVRGSSTPVPHVDTFASQTPSRQVVAVKSLWLLKSKSDPAPLKVIDVGASAVEVDLVSAKTFDVATVSLKSLPMGTYTIAKVGVSYVRYAVAARLHTPLPVDGRYDNVQALSDGAVIDGQPRAKGWYRASFAVGATTYGSLEGPDAPLPQLPGSGGMTLDTSGAESFYVFPVEVNVNPNEPNDLRIVCAVNVHESFRWQDQTLLGYASNVFDATPTTYEPVMSFGASAFELLVEPK